MWVILPFSAEFCTLMIGTATPPSGCSGDAAGVSCGKVFTDNCKLVSESAENEDNKCSRTT